MSDEALRALEREVAAGGGNAARVRLAAELERLGRRDEAIDALLPARDDAEARRAIARIVPAVLEGTFAPTSFRDVASLERAPHVRWRFQASASPLRNVDATSLGVIVFSLDGTAVLDPETGRLLRSLGAGTARLFREDALLLTSTDDIRVVDLWTDRLIARSRCEHSQRIALTDAATFFLGNELYGLTSPKTPDGFRWGPIGPFKGALAAEDIVLVQERRGRHRRVVLIGIDRVSGSERFQLHDVPFPRADARGIVSARARSLDAYDLHGTSLFQRPFTPLAVAPDFILGAKTEGDGVPAMLSFWRIDRPSGDVTPFPLHGNGELEIARDVIYTTTREGAIRALRADGTPLWTFEAAEIRSIQRIVPGHRRLYVLARDTVYCLAE